MQWSPHSPTALQDDCVLHRKAARLPLIDPSHFDTQNASFFGGVPALPEAAGYIVVLGFGLCFSLFTTLLVYLDKWLFGTAYTSEQFNTAGPQPRNSEAPFV